MKRLLLALTILLLAGCISSGPAIWQFDHFADSAVGLVTPVSVFPGSSNEPESAVLVVSGVDGEADLGDWDSYSESWTAAVLPRGAGSMALALHNDGDVDTDPDASASGWTVREPALLAVELSAEMPGRALASAEPIQFLAERAHTWTLMVADDSGEALHGEGSLPILDSPWSGLRDAVTPEGTAFATARIAVTLRPRQLDMVAFMKLDTVGTADGEVGAIELELLDGRLLASPDFVPRSYDPAFSLQLAQSSDLAGLRIQDETGEPVAANLMHRHLNPELEGVTIPELEDSGTACGYDLYVGQGSDAVSVQYCYADQCVTGTVTGALEVPSAGECPDLELTRGGFEPTD